MTTTMQVSPRAAVIPLHAAWGAAAGVVGGIGMGIWMSVSRPMMDTAMITMVAGLLGSTNAVAGWLIHLAIAVSFGLAFGALLGSYAQKLVPAAVLGLGFGVVAWLIGAMWIMPANMGMPVFEWNDVTSSSFGAHLVFGLLLGLAFAFIASMMGKKRTGSA
ncbi:hypothetical protein JGS22_016410 [Streptomyces sp. P38-E01]|uniref:Uncharacterized protein n=1 Tax=Streptomyces tardus TaxID=2780544 RepID=A0A949N2P3_9ACTN|nr:hypothetical protein [Streptomyces tardus]MBU7599150.1 hypothetical protein [Streptomyces tardus]